MRPAYNAVHGFNARRMVHPTRKIDRDAPYPGSGARLEVATLRKHGRAPAPPNLFGPYNRTGFLAALADQGPLRANELRGQFGANSIMPRHEDVSGLITRWLRSPRARMVALNPGFPLAAPLRRLLGSLAKSYPVPVLRTIGTSTISVPKAAKSREADLDVLFGSRVRTLTLVSLEVLGGIASLNMLKRCVPGEYYKSVRTALKHFVAEGVLIRRGDNLEFRSTPWMGELRQLLRAYARIRSSIRDDIRGAAHGHASRPGRLENFDLLGPQAASRILVALARNGPMRYARLFAEARTECDKSLTSLKRMGVVVDRSERRVRTISLNRAHPVYRELRRLLAAIAGGDDPTAVSDFEASASFDVDMLFGRRLRTSVLLAIDAAQSGLDASSLQRVLPEHDLFNLRRCLEQFERLGVLGKRRWKNTLYYDFDRDYAYYPALRGLLGPINNRWPSYAAAGVDVLPQIEPLGRRRMRGHASG